MSFHTIPLGKYKKDILLTKRKVKSFSLIPIYFPTLLSIWNISAFSQQSPTRFPLKAHHSLELSAHLQSLRVLTCDFAPLNSKSSHCLLARRTTSALLHIYNYTILHRIRAIRSDVRRTSAVSKAKVNYILLQNICDRSATKEGRLHQSTS